MTWVGTGVGRGDSGWAHCCVLPRESGQQNCDSLSPSFSHLRNQDRHCAQGTGGKTGSSSTVQFCEMPAG